MYQAIIFDIGGVLVDWNPRDYLMERFGHKAVYEKVYSITFGSSEWVQLDGGLLSRYSAEKIMMEKAQKAGCEFEVREVLDNWTRILKPRHRVIDLARNLKKNGYAIYYLSNIAADTLAYVQEMGILDEFDGGIASCDVRCCKPQPEIYNAFLEKYNLAAADCVFIDDTDANVRGAFDAGITAIALRRSVNGLIRNLRSCGIRIK